MKPHNQHPVEPPSQDLVRKWIEDWGGGQMKGPVTEYLMEIATQAARWGADQELEACCEWLQDPDLNVDTYKLRSARRPKPPSLKEQALSEATNLVVELDRAGMRSAASRIEGTIRRALESLPE